jgi:hypothetical protein
VEKLAQADRIIIAIVGVAILAALLEALSHVSAMLSEANIRITRTVLLAAFAVALVAWPDIHDYVTVGRLMHDQFRIQKAEADEINTMLRYPYDQCALQEAQREYDAAAHDGLSDASGVAAEFGQSMRVPPQPPAEASPCL